jgi:hypothetical protein
MTDVSMLVMAEPCDCSALRSLAHVGKHRLPSASWLAVRVMH